MLKEFTNHSLFTLNETAQEIDDLSHDVRSWSAYVAYLLESLEFFAMANDPNHPEDFELMLRTLQSEINSRLRNGKWGITIDR